MIDGFDPSEWQTKGNAVLWAGGRAVFGDRVGCALFLGALLFFAMTWRVGFFITDNYTLANTLLALEDGHLYFTAVQYGPASGASPGTNLVGDLLYGRNYGQVVLALPILWGLRLVEAVADVQVAIVGAVSLLLLAFTRQLGAVFEREREAAIAGGASAVLLFWLNVAFSFGIVSRWVPLIALQLSTMVAAALVSVVLYRLAGDLYDTKTGVFASIVVVLGSPIGFWATIPKRHSLMALLVLLTLYSLYRSRAAETDSAAIRFNALAYVWVGLTAWIHAANALVLLVSLAGADLVSNPRLSWRRVLAIGLTFLVSLVPFFVTNLLVSGHPFKPPRMLVGYRGDESAVIGDTSIDAHDSRTPAQATGEPPDGGPTPTADGTHSSRSLPAIVAGLVRAVSGKFALFQGYIERGVALFTDFDRLYHAFLRGRFVTDKASGLPAARLAVVQSMPLLGAVWMLAVSGLRRVSKRLQAVHDVDRPVFAMDVFVLTYSVLLSALYLPRIPIHAAITVRYLHTLYPLGVYLLVRTGAVRRVVDANWRLLWLSYASTVLIGGQLVVVAFVYLEPTRNRALILIGEMSLISASLLAVWGVTTRLPDGIRSGITEEHLDRLGAIAMALAAGTITVFILLSAFELFDVDRVFALPLARVLSEAIEFLP